MNRTSVLGVMVVAGLAMSLSGAGVAMAQEKAAPNKVESSKAESTKAEAGKSSTPTLPPAETKLPSDPRLVTGQLDNGLKYIVMKHGNPPGRAQMYIHVSSGSLNETDEQRGIAHYLEHMAFNGSENFKAGTVVDFFQSMGLTFGQHQNAFTSFDQTTYILSFPDTKPETMERGMRFFSDVATRLTLSQEEINQERQIILEEKRSRLGAQQRMQDYVLERLAPGSLLGVRLPIGTEQTLLKVNRPNFVDYYDKWYVPSNMTVMVVADADEQDVVKTIAKTFGGGEKKPKPVDNDPKIRPYDATRAIVVSDPEQPRAELSITRILPKREPTTTVGEMRRDLVEQIAQSAFNRRIGAKLAKGGVSYLSASASASDLFNAARIMQVDIEGEGNQWKQMLAEVGTELQRARLHGFSDREIADVKAAIIAGAEQAVEREKTMRGDIVIRQMNSAVASGEPIMSASQELELVKAALPTITKDEAAKAFKEMFDPTNVTFVAQLPANVEGGVPSESDLIALGRKAVDVSPAAEAEVERPSTLMAKVPSAGKILDQSEHAASKVTSAWLDNGALVHYRFMDYRKDQATITITMAAGVLQETLATRGIAEAAGLAFSRPATSTLSSTNIRDLMTGKKVRVGGGVGIDTISLSISGNPSEMETGMQLAHLLLTDPVIEPAALEQWKKTQLQEIEERSKTPQGVFAEALAATLFPPEEARTKPLNKDQVNAVTLEAAQKWLREAIKTAPIEVSVVGDIKADQAMQLVSAYVGSLPKRDRMSGKTLDELRVVKRPVGPIATERVVDTKTPVSIVAVGFYASDAENIADTRRLQMAARVLNTRILKKVREEEQLAYSPGASVQPATALPGFGTFVCFSPTEPKKATRLAQAVDEIFIEFAKNGPTEEEMTTARKQVANTMDEQMKEPSFWSTRTSAMAYRNVNLDDVMGAPEDYQKLSAGEIREVFAKYYTDANKMKVVVSPAGGSESGASEAKPTEPNAKPAAPVKN